MSRNETLTRWVKAVPFLLLTVLWGSTARAAETTTYVLTDVQGTVLAREDAHGTTIATYDYRPYGKQQTGPTTAGPGYTGHVNDQNTGLVYMQARYYDPSTGRFLSADPIRPTPASLFNFNVYVYANNNPGLYVDIDGRQSTEPQVVEVDLSAYRPSLDPRSSPLLQTVGKSVAADVAFVVGAATNDNSLQATAVEAMQDATSGGQGSEAALTLITMGKGGEVNVAGVKMEPTVTGARAALEGAGYPGKPITNRSGSEQGTLHNVPNLKTDVRVMDGGPNHPARIVTTRQGTSQAVHPETGRNIGGNLSKSEQSAINHIPLRTNP